MLAQYSFFHFGYQVKLRFLTTSSQIEILTFSKTLKDMEPFMNDLFRQLRKTGEELQVSY